MRWVITVAWMTVSSSLTGFFELDTVLQRKYVYDATLVGVLCGAVDPNVPAVCI
jgi:hypothetical protein